MGESGKRLALAAASLVLGLALAEGALRLAGYSFAVAPQSVEFGWPDPVAMRGLYVPDPHLFFVPRNYTRRLLRLARHPPRIVFLGDSCTEFGRYPGEFARLVADRRGGRGIRWANLGVGGWTSLQGLRQLERDVVRLRPDAVTLYFGWNDHWVGFGIEDDEVASLVGGYAPFDRLRLAQLAFQSHLALRARRRGETPTRVPPSDFRANLTAMVEVARAAGIVPVLLTAPTSIEPGREPEHLVERWILDESRVVPLHAEYVSIVREVGEAEGAPVCDLARRFGELPAETRRELFLLDGIHYRPEGSVRAAEFLLACFEEDPRLAALPWMAPPEGDAGRAP